MSPARAPVLAAAALGAAALVLARLVVAWRTWRTYRGPRVVLCPEDGRPAAVEIRHGLAALSAAFGRLTLAPRSCSSLPRDGCRRRCCAAIEAGPTECVPRTVVVRWATDKRCAACGKRLAARHTPGFEPALRRPDGTTTAWKDVPPEQLLTRLAEDEPVCWYCHVVSPLRGARRAG